MVSVVGENWSASVTVALIAALLSTTRFVFITYLSESYYRETLVRSTSGPDGDFTVPSFSPVTNMSKFFRRVTV